MGISVKCLAGCLLMVTLAISSVGAAGLPVPLIEAVKKGDTATVRALLQQRADVNASEVDGTTALHWAAHRGDLETTGLLLGAGANVRAVTRYGIAPLSLACENGNTATVEKLLNAGADPNTKQPGGETALMTAARTGNPEVVQALVARGADVNAKESWKGQTALMWAASEGNAAAIKALLEAGADVTARSRPSPDLTPVEPGDKGFTALLFAVRAGRIDAARALLAGGAKVNETLSDGTGALVLAIIGAQFDMGVFLLENGADPNAAAQGWTALHQMAWTRRPNRGVNTVGPVARGQVDSLEMVKQLISHGADVNARMTKEIPTIYSGRNLLKRVGATPFLLAAHRLDIDLMRLLAANGADTRRTNDNMTTPLMVAAGVGLYFPGESPGTPDEVTEAVKLCLELDNDVTAVDANGDTALHGTAYWDAPEAAKLLVAAGAKLNTENKRGWTPLRVADGVAYTGSIHNSPTTAALLRQMLQEHGLPVPAPILGDGGRRVGPIRQPGRDAADSPQQTQQKGSAEQKPAEAQRAR